MTPTDLSRRDMLAGTAATATLAVTPAAFAMDARSIKDKWAEVLANAKKFRGVALANKLTGSWERPAPITLDFAPPASEADVVAVEHQLGHKLPTGLRAFFLEASAGFEIYWLLPGLQTTSPDGVTNVIISALPPEPLVEISTWGGTPHPEPKINGSQFKLALHDLVARRDGAREWIESFDAARDRETDLRGRLHYQRYADFWRRGIPLTTGGGGDVIAADRESEDGSILMLFHDGSDEPGWFLERSLIDLMVDVSRLGFVGPDISELIVFRADDRTPGPRATAFAEAHKADAVTHNLAMPSSVVLSPDSMAGYIWRRWLGLV